MGSVAELLFGVAPGLQERAKTSTNYIMIPCPFHSGGAERTPSCSVSTVKPVFFCHGCGESGHIYRILRFYGIGKDSASTLIDSLGFDRARRNKARREAIGDLTDGTEHEAKNPYRGVYILDEDTLDAYRAQPQQLRHDGFDEATLRHFEVGWDSHNMRITFPIRDYYGGLVGISGRRTFGGDEDGPKYRIYDRELTERTDVRAPHGYSMEAVKRGVLWHMHTVKSYLWDAGEPVILVEGFKACMWTWQSGYKTVIATMGTVVTRFHVELIARMGVPVYLFLDNNPAGIIGTYKAGAKLVGSCDVHIVRYPDEREQPDGLEPEEIGDAIRNSQRFVRWKQHNEQLHEIPTASLRQPFRPRKTG